MRSITPEAKSCRVAHDAAPVPKQPVVHPDEDAPIGLQAGAPVSTSANSKGVYIYDGFKFTIQRMEMRRIVVAEVNVDSNAIESTEFRHLDSAQRTSGEGTSRRRICL